MPETSVLQKVARSGSRKGSDSQDDGATHLDVSVVTQTSIAVCPSGCVESEEFFAQRPEIHEALGKTPESE